MKNLLRLFDFYPQGVLGMNRRNIEMILPRNNRRYFPLANNKLLTKVTLAQSEIPVAPTLATFESFHEISDFEHRLEGQNEFVVKPTRGSGGKGILVISDRRNDVFKTAGGRLLTAEDLKRHIADIVFGVYSFDRADVALIEPRLKPNGFFTLLYPYGLSDVRIILVDDMPALCMLRVPTAESDGRANLHQGALGIAVDMDTGTTNRAWHKRRAINEHPESGVNLIGCEIPEWTDIVRIAVRTAHALPLKYLGVDLVVDRQLGPLVLEVNARPGIEIQNVTGRSLLDVMANLATENERVFS